MKVSLRGFPEKNPSYFQSRVTHLSHIDFKGRLACLLLNNVSARSISLISRKQAGNCFYGLTHSPVRMRLKKKVKVNNTHRRSQTVMATCFTFDDESFLIVGSVCPSFLWGFSSGTSEVICS